MVQVIQGNGLRCLFADNPPSTTNTANPAYSAAHYPSRTPYGVVQPPHFGAGGPGSYVASMFAHGQDRDEIVIVSEDRVMALRLAGGSNTSDGASQSTRPFYTQSTTLVGH